MLFEEPVGKLRGRGRVRLKLDKQEIAGAWIHTLHQRASVVKPSS